MREVEIEWEDGVSETVEAEGVSQREDGIYILLSEKKAMWLNRYFVRRMVVTLKGGEKSE